MFPSIISFGSFSEVSDSSGRAKESLKTGLFLNLDVEVKIFCKILPETTKQSVRFLGDLGSERYFPSVT